MVAFLPFVLEFERRARKPPRCAGGVVTRSRRSVLARLATPAAAIATLAGLFAVPAGAAAQRDVTSRFSANTRGDVTTAANSIPTCRPDTTGGGTACAVAQTQTDGPRKNDDFPMDLIDVDVDASTFDWNIATPVLPAASTVAWAGLYWACSSRNVGDPAPVPALRDQAVLRAPGAAAYASLTASVFDTLARWGGIAFADVTVTGARRWRRRVPGCRRSVCQLHGEHGRRRRLGPPRRPGALRRLRGRRAPRAQPDRRARLSGVPRGALDTAAMPVNGFVTPASPEVVRSRVGIVIGDGDRGATDTLSLQCTMPMGTPTLLGETGPGALNPTHDIGNSTITRFGAQTMRNPSYLNTLGWDADLFDTTGILPNGCRGAEVRALGSTGEGNAIGVITFATDIFTPEVTIAKTAADVNGAPLQRGDELEYTLVVRYAGCDPAVGVVVRDPVPAGTTYVPGSLRIGGAPCTDAAGDDAANFEAGTSTAVFRLGTRANATVGGQLNPGATVTVSFRVRIDPGLPGGSTISNTASATYNGLTLGPGTTFTASSDGDPTEPGDQPTVLTLSPT